MERVYGHRLADWGISWLYCTDENEAGDFEAVTAAGAAADLGTFRAHCARTRQIMAAHQLDDTRLASSAYAWNCPSSTPGTRPFVSRLMRASVGAPSMLRS
jgi:hypothetical protein